MSDWPIDVEIKHSNETAFNQPVTQLTVTVHMSTELFNGALERVDTENDLVHFIEEAVRNKLYDYAEK